MGILCAVIFFFFFFFSLGGGEGGGSDHYTTHTLDDEGERYLPTQDVSPVFYFAPTVC
jgi:hypothetical protein